MSSLQPLDEVRGALSSAWDLGRAGFWWRAAESAAQAGDWRTATQRLLNLADALDDVPNYSPAWRQLAIAAFDGAMRARDADLVTACCAQLLTHAWDARDELDALRRIFVVAEGLGAFDAAATLARILRNRYSGSAWAHYATGHFGELAARTKGLAPPDAGSLIECFERASALFEHRAQMRESRHARMRAAVLQLVSTTRQEEARKQLRALADTTPTDEAYWLAFGQVHSPFWLDRVRGADWIVDALAEDTPDSNARKVAAALAARLPLRLADAELDRFRGVAEDLQDDLRWVIEAQLRGREAAADLLDQPLEELDSERAAELADEALPLRGFEAIVKAWRGDDIETPPEDELTLAVVAALSATTEELPDRLSALALSVRATDSPRALAPLLLVFVRATPLDSTELAGPLTELALHYAHRAPSPSCGFLHVARAFFDAGMPRAGAALTRRALDDPTRNPALNTCVARAISWAVREGSDREMLAWLDAGERELAL